MSYQIKLRPELLEDASEGYSWYEERAPGLGYDFLRVFYATASRIERQPNLSRKVYSDFRRLLLRRYPYFLYYRIEGDMIICLLLFHCARNPRAMRRTLRHRREV